MRLKPVLLFFFFPSSSFITLWLIQIKLKDGFGVLLDFRVKAPATLVLHIKQTHLLSFLTIFLGKERKRLKNHSYSFCGSTEEVDVTLKFFWGMKISLHPSFLPFLTCYIKHIGSGNWRLMPGHLNWIHLPLRAAWMTAQRRDTSTRQEPPTTHSRLLALALCLLWQETQVTRSKSDSGQGLQLSGVPGTMFCPIRTTYVQSHLVARGSVTEAAGACVVFCLSQAILQVCILLRQEVEIGETAS